MQGSRVAAVRFVLRSGGQIIVSVMATLAATAIYGALRHDPGAPLARTEPGMLTTNGTKFTTRAPGAEPTLSGSQQPRLPLLSVIDWRPPTAGDWPDATVPLLPPARPAIRPPHAPKHAGARAAVTAPPAGEAAETRPAPQDVVAGEGVEPGPWILNAASGAAGSVTTAMDAVGGVMISAARGAASFSGPMLRRLLP